MNRVRFKKRKQPADFVVAKDTNCQYRVIEREEAEKDFLEWTIVDLTGTFSTSEASKALFEFVIENAKRKIF